MFERLALAALACSLSPLAQGQDAPSLADAAAQLERLDASLATVSQLLERQVAQTDAVLAMQHVALQTLQALRFEDRVEALLETVHSQGETLTYLAQQVRSKEEAADSAGLDKGQREARAGELESYREALRAARDEMREEELALAEAQSDLTRCKEDLQGWQARVDRYLTLRGH